VSEHSAYLVLWIDTRSLSLGQHGPARFAVLAGIYSEPTPSSTRGHWPVSLLKATSRQSYDHAKRELALRLTDSAYEWLWVLLDKWRPDWRPS
jgi:hypothetical protein